MGRLTFKKWFECFKPDEETTTILVNGYTQIVEPDEIYARNSNYYLVGTAVNKLSEYEDAEEQGLLLHLPFDVGSKIYVLVKMFDVMNNKMPYRIEVYTVNKYIYNHLKNFVIVAVRKYGAAISEEHFFVGEIGKRIFKTYAEAEAALQEKEGK